MPFVLVCVKLQFMILQIDERVENATVLQISSPSTESRHIISQKRVDCLKISETVSKNTFFLAFLVVSGLMKFKNDTNEE